MYLNHVEILRTSTSEPTRGAGIYWTVLKDVTSYARLFEQPGHVILDLGNGIDLGKNLDGEFAGECISCHTETCAEEDSVAVSLSADFYVGRNGHSHTDPHADFILPISNLRTDLPNYFSIEENGEPGFQWIKLPSVSFS